jgi:transglutaminase-like putative cysteine protease
MSKVKTILRLPLAEKGLLLETLVLLALARMAVLLLPFRWLAWVLGKQQAQTPVQEDPAKALPIRLIGAMVRKASKNVPWTSNCLDQALVAKIMLSRRGIATTVYFGVKNDENGQFAAHAWL